jgi:hypothetical protein
MRKWEYKLLVPISTNPLDDSNELGEEGWELVQVVAGSGDTAAVWVFKRPKQ